MTVVRSERKDVMVITTVTIIITILQSIYQFLFMNWVTFNKNPANQ